MYRAVERQRDRETERQRDRETEKQRDRGTGGQRDRETERQGDRETERRRDIETERQRDREAVRKICSKKSEARLMSAHMNIRLFSHAYGSFHMYEHDSFHVYNLQQKICSKTRECTYECICNLNSACMHNLNSIQTRGKCEAENL